MKERNLTTHSALLLVAGALVLSGGCSSEPEKGPNDSSVDPKGNGDDKDDEDRFKTPDLGPSALDDRVIDYNAALRTASLKLTDAPPSLEQIQAVRGSDDPAETYAAYIDEMLESPQFGQRMIRWWKDTMRQGGGSMNGGPNRDTAPIFAARLIVEDRPLTELFTATENTCPTYDTETQSFVDGDCDNGVETHAGVLTNPGTMHQFYGNMAFRRARWVQEIFACSKFPAEASDSPIEIDGKEYISPWDIETIATEPIDFRDTSSVVCANCHTTMNHLAPLFANFDMNGQMQDSIQVMTPTAPDPTTTELSHWLVDGETMHWRYDTPVDSIPELGAAMAADPNVAACVVTRFWNWTLSKEDVVDGLATVPFEVIEPYYEEFDASGFDAKTILRYMLLSEDFVSY